MSQHYSSRMRRIILCIIISLRVKIASSINIMFLHNSEFVINQKQTLTAKRNWKFNLFNVSGMIKTEILITLSSGHFTRYSRKCRNSSSCPELSNLTARFLESMHWKPSKLNFIVQNTYNIHPQKLSVYYSFNYFQRKNFPNNNSNKLN